MAIKINNCREKEMANSIRSIGELLIAKADDIVKDIDKDYVSGVTIYASLTGDWGSAPSVSISKDYIVIGEPKQKVEVINFPKAKGDD